MLSLSDFMTLTNPVSLDVFDTQRHSLGEGGLNMVLGCLIALPHSQTVQSIPSVRVLL